MSLSGDPQRVIEFWFETLEPAQWWRKNPVMDDTIARQFGEILISAKKCELASWRDTAHGRLAEIIVLDQFSRNIHRDTADAFSADSMALTLAQEAVRLGIDQTLSQSHRRFLYMPFMHSESGRIHQQALEIYTELADPGSLDSEIRHKQIIDQFGRYPHRNNILKRKSSAEEIEFLKQPGSYF